MNRLVIFIFTLSTLFFTAGHAVKIVDKTTMSAVFYVEDGEFSEEVLFLAVDGKEYPLKPVSFIDPFRARVTLDLKLGEHTLEWHVKRGSAASFGAPDVSKNEKIFLIDDHDESLSFSINGNKLHINSSPKK